MTSQIIFAGFGGQGILFSGKFLAYNGLIAGKYLSWLPSYGPEMRGGNANCSVILSDTPVGSPIVTYPDMLVVMNNPSLDKYESTVKKGGTIIIDSSLIERKVKRDDVSVFIREDLVHIRPVEHGYAKPFGLRLQGLGHIL